MSFQQSLFDELDKQATSWAEHASVAAETADAVRHSGAIGAARQYIKSSGGVIPAARLAGSMALQDAGKAARRVGLLPPQRKPKMVKTALNIKALKAGWNGRVLDGRMEDIRGKLLSGASKNSMNDRQHARYDAALTRTSDAAKSINLGHGARKVVRRINRAIAGVKSAPTRPMSGTERTAMGPGISKALKDGDYHTVKLPGLWGDK